MLTKRFIGIIGILIPIICSIGFGVYHTIIVMIRDPYVMENPKMISLTAYNLYYTFNDIKHTITGVYWIRWVNYITVGLLIIVFSASLYIHSKNSTINKTASIFLLVSGLTWLSFGAIDVNMIHYSMEELLSGREFLTYRTIFCLFSAAIGFLLLCKSIYKIIPRKKTKHFLLINSSLLLVATAVTILFHSYILNPEFFYQNSYLQNPYHYQIVSYITWGIYFTTFGILGFKMLQSNKHNVLSNTL